MLAELFVCFIIIGVAWKLLGKAVEKAALCSIESEFFDNMYVPGVNYTIFKKYILKILRCKKISDYTVEYIESLVKASVGLYENNLMHFWKRIEIRMDECSRSTGLYAYTEVNKVIDEVYEEMYNSLAPKNRERFDNYREDTL